MAQAIEVNHFSKTYRTGFRSKPFHAVTDLSFEIPNGSVIGFLGPNGAGKTTTIGAILGLLTPSAGNIRVFGEDPNTPSVRQRIGHVAEVHPAYLTVSAREQLVYLGRLSGIPEARIHDRVEEVLERVKLTDTGKKVAKKFSKGMIQRLGLAQALLHDPKLLILDEPTTGLDPEGRHLFMDIVRSEARNGNTVFFSTHILADVEELCDRVVIIKGGQLVREIDLRNQDGSEKTWVITFSDPSGNAVRLLREISLSVTSPSDNQFSVMLGESKKSATVAHLVSAGAEIHSMSPKVESIEQLYLSLVGGDSNGAS